MVDVEDDIIAAGAEIIWVLEADTAGQPGNAQRCMDFMDFFGSTQGWCVGDNQTEPEAGTFDNSPFSQGRGFDIIVPTDSMVIEYTTNHGTPSGNDNPRVKRSFRPSSTSWVNDPQGLQIGSSVMSSVVRSARMSPGTSVASS